MLRIANLAGVFTGEGFARKQGRHPQPEDCGYLSGPIDIVCSPETGRIVSIGPPDRQRKAAEEQLLDGTGCFATAGFIDSHTHAIFAGDRTGEHFARWAGRSYQEITAAGGGIHSTVRATNEATDEELTESLVTRLRAMLACGSTVVEVKSGYADKPEGELRLLRLIQRARQQRGLPEVRATFLGLHALPAGWLEQDYCSAMIDILPVIRDERLADFVDAFPERGFFSLHVTKRFVQAAAEHGLRAKIHADELSDLGTSAAMIREKALSIDHVEEINAEATAMLGDSATVATLLPATSFFLDIPFANARRLIDSGARVALATDYNPGSAPAFDFQLTNLLAASQLRMTSAEILCACTYNAAAALGLEDTHGALGVGRAASLLVWDRNAGDSIGLGQQNWLNSLLIGRRKPRFVVVQGKPDAR